MQLNTVSLKDVELGFPVLAEQVVFVRVDGYELKEAKSKAGNNLVLKLTILNETLLTKEGEEIQNGTPESPRFKNMHHYVSLVPTEKYTPQRIAATLKELAVAIKLPEDREFINLEDFDGHPIMKATVTIEPASGQYSESNRFQGFKPVEESDGLNVSPM